MRPSPVLRNRGSVSPRWGILLIAGSLLALCVFRVLPAVFTDTSRWVATEGRLVEVRPATRGHFRVRYTYEVGGREYTGRRVALWSDTLRFPTGRVVPEPWQPGARVTVHHHPTEPERAVLDPAQSPVRKAAAVFGTVLCLVAIVGVLLPGARVG